jgi:hypothetical protein
MMGQALADREVSKMAYGIRMAVSEMAQMRALEMTRREPRERLTKAIDAVDTVLDRLEELNLDERSRLPETADVRIALALKSVPVELRPALSQRESIRRLMNDLYRAQERLMALRSGPEWEWLRETDCELPDSA